MNKGLNAFLLPLYKLLRKKYATKKQVSDIEEEIDDIKTFMEVTNIRELTDAQCEKLKAGDTLVKVTGNDKHSYKVSYKGTGICLTYTDASLVETVSYDKIDGHWVYNSTDIMPLVNVENAQSGTIDKALGLDTSGHLVKGNVSGGTQLYKHVISLDFVESNYQENAVGTIIIISNSNSPLSVEYDNDLGMYCIKNVSLNNIIEGLMYYKVGTNSTDKKDLIAEEYTPTSNDFLTGYINLFVIDTLNTQPTDVVTAL